jgi:hypothetical protein
LWDLQKQRIGAGNRVAAMERDGVGDDAESIRSVVLAYAAIENEIDRKLTKLVKQHFMATGSRSSAASACPASRACSG